MARETEQPLGKRAVVIGAGMGGLMAAGVLARYFAEVTVLDKDTLPTSPEPRMDVPQGAHAHVLLLQGRRNIEKIFPGFLSDAVDGGAIISRLGLEIHSRDWLGWLPKRDVGSPCAFMTRPMMEGTVRSHLKRNDRVTLRDGVTVTGWREVDQAIAVSIAVDGGPDETLTADFVVDATGRAGTALAMLEASGYGPVEETVIGTGESYSSTLFEIPPGRNDASHSFVIWGAPPASQSGFLFAVEGNRWICSLNGRFDEAPPKDPAGFMEFARKLSDPCIYERISLAKQLGPIRMFKPAYSKWRRYDKLTNFPGRLVPLGDAIAMVNPIYGQGMTLASTHAICLWQALADRVKSGGLDDIATEYLAATSTFTEQVWSGLEVVEFAFPKTTGERPADIEQRQAFVQGVRRLAVEDAEVHGLITRVNQLVEPASVLGREDIVARVQALMAAEQESS